MVEVGAAEEGAEGAAEEVKAACQEGGAKRRAQPGGVALARESIAGDGTLCRQGDEAGPRWNQARQG